MALIFTVLSYAAAGCEAAAEFFEDATCETVCAAGFFANAVGVGVVQVMDVHKKYRCDDVMKNANYFIKTLGGNPRNSCSQSPSVTVRLRIQFCCGGAASPAPLPAAASGALCRLPHDSAIHCPAFCCFENTLQAVCDWQRHDASAA